MLLCKESLIRTIALTKLNACKYIAYRRFCNAKYRENTSLFFRCYYLYLGIPQGFCFIIPESIL